MITPNKKARIIYLFSSLILITAGIGFAQEVKKDEKEKVKATSAMKEIQGEVSAINKQGIAIVYEKDAGNNKDYEIYLPIDKNLKLEHKQSLNQINAGDTVKVQYEETAEEDKDGPKISGHTAKVITFIRPAPKEPDTSVLESTAEPEKQVLPIKGLKEGT